MFGGMMLMVLFVLCYDCDVFDCVDIVLCYGYGEWEGVDSVLVCFDWLIVMVVLVLFVCYGFVVLFVFE